MPETLTVYLAGPINDCTDEECKGWRQRMKEELPEINFLDPMRRDYRGIEAQTDIAQRIVEDDKSDIDQSDIVFVYHDKPSVGTSMEILYAFEREIYIIVVGCTGKPLSPWILYHSDKILNSLEEGIEDLRMLIKDWGMYEVPNWDDGV